MTLKKIIQLLELILSANIKYLGMLLIEVGLYKCLNKNRSIIST